MTARGGFSFEFRSIIACRLCDDGEVAILDVLNVNADAAFKRVMGSAESVDFLAERSDFFKG